MLVNTKNRESNIRNQALKLILRIAKYEYPRAAWAAYYIILTQEQVDGFCSDTHKASSAAIGICFALLFLYYCQCFAVICLRDAIENPQPLLGYILRSLVPLGLDFSDFGLVFGCHLLGFFSDLLKCLLPLVYLALDTFTLGFVRLAVLHQFQNLGFGFGIVGLGCIKLGEDCCVFLVRLCGVKMGS